MAWIKISDEDGGVYALEPDPDPAVIVSVEEIEAEIAELQERIKAAEANLIPVPEKADARVAEAVGLYNEQNALREKIAIEIKVGDKIELLNKLKAL